MPNEYDLYEAIKKAIKSSADKKLFDEALNEIELSISEGGSPISYRRDSDDFDNKSISVIAFAIRTGNFHIIKRVIDSFEKHNRVIPLMFKISEDGSKDKLNVAQYLVSHCSDPKIVSLFIAHAKKTGQIFYNDANSEFLVRNGAEELHPSIAEYITFSINIHALLSNIKLDNYTHSSAEQAKIKAAFRKWYTISLDDIEIPAELTSEKPVRVFFDCNEDLLALLMNKKLVDLEALTVCGKSFSDLIKEAAVLPDVEAFESLLDYISLYSRNPKIIKPENVRQEDKYPKGVYVLTVEYRNLFGKHPITVEVVFDMRRLHEKVLEMQTTVRRASFDALKHRLSQVPSERLKALRAEYQHGTVARECFEAVYHEIKKNFHGFDIVSLKLLHANANHVNTKVATVARAAFAAVLHSAAGFGGQVAAEGVKSAADVWIQRAEANAAKGISDSQLGLDLEIFAMDAANLIAKYVQNTNQPAGCVAQICKALALQIKSLKNGKHKFSSNEEMAGYLAACVVTEDAQDVLKGKPLLLSRPSPANGSGASGSTPADDGSNEWSSGHLKDITAPDEKGGCVPGCNVS
jgi:hypothetical protein